METITIVDQQDNIIAAKLRNDLVAGDIYRIAGIWIVSNTGGILLARRKTDKKAEAGKWDTAAAGTVAAGESYEQTIVREVKEELGLQDLNIQTAPKIFIEDKVSYFCQCFRAVLDHSTDIQIQKDEVAQVRWFSRDFLLADTTDHPNLYTLALHGHCIICKAAWYILCDQI